MQLQVLVHVVRVPEQVWLVAPALLQALVLGAVEVVGQNRLVVGVCALLDDLARSLGWSHAGDAGESLLGDHDVQVVLGLVDVGNLWDVSVKDGQWVRWDVVPLARYTRHRLGLSWMGESMGCA